MRIQPGDSGGCRHPWCMRRRCGVYCWRTRPDAWARVPPCLSVPLHSECAPEVLAVDFGKRFPQVGFRRSRRGRASGCVSRVRGHGAELLDNVPAFPRFHLYGWRSERETASRSISGRGVSPLSAREPVGSILSLYSKVRAKVRARVRR